MRGGKIVKHYWANVAVPNDGDNSVSFTIELRNKCRFILRECYFTMYKAMYNEFVDSDFFRIDVVKENKERAEKEMRHAIEFLVYITGVPYELDYLRENSDIYIAPIDMSLSKKKIRNLEELDRQYRKVRKKRELLENTMRLYSLALKYSDLFEDTEESFFAMFRIIEKIAKDEYEIEKSTIGDGKNEMRVIVKKIISDYYGIKMPPEKIDIFTGKLSKKLINDVFTDIYSKIAWFCKRKNIEYDENVLSKAVNIRNSLAHGENVFINPMSREYKLVSQLSHSFIQEKFFDNVEESYYLNTTIHY